MDNVLELAINRSGWAMWCRVDGCKQRMVIRYAPGDAAGALLAALQHVKDHHWHDSVEIHCNHHDIVQMVQENRNPNDSPVMREVNLLYRMLSRCVLRAAGEKDIPEAVRLSRLCSALEPL